MLLPQDASSPVPAAATALIHAVVLPAFPEVMLNALLS
jgi:hypothetical protein